MVLRDVTELRRLENVRREFVANVSHELRTPLASIRAIAETLEAGAADDPTVAADFLKRIIGEVDHLVELVNELLDLARLESGRAVITVETCDPVDVLMRAVERLRPQVERAGLVLRVDVSPTSSGARRSRSYRASPHQSPSQRREVHSRGRRIIVSAGLRDGMVRLSVRDTGVGITAEERASSSASTRPTRPDAQQDPGWAWRSPSTLCKPGGTIWAAPGHGTTFSFTIPLATPPDGAPAPEH